MKQRSVVQDEQLPLMLSPIDRVMLPFSVEPRLVSALAELLIAVATQEEARAEGARDERKDP